MKTQLSNIASVHSGIYAKPEYEGEVYYIQANHFNASKEFDVYVKPNLKLEGKIKTHLLQTGDILLAAKGNNNFAVLYKDIIKPAVASSTFIVIRIKDKQTALPEFVTWFLNLPSTQAFLQSSSKGSGIPSITKNIIEHLEITIPPVQKQLSIIKFHSLRKLEQSIYKQLDDLKEQQIQHLLLTALK